MTEITPEQNFGCGMMVLIFMFLSLFTLILLIS